MVSSMASAARSVVSSFADVATAQGKISFASQHAQVREFEGATARLAVSTGRDLETVRAGFEKTGVSIGKRPGEVAAWANEVGKLTYNFKGASEAIEGISGLAAQTGRSAEDYRGLAVELGTVGKVAGSTEHAIGVITSQAEKLGVQGGVAAFADQIEGLSDTISQFAVSSERDFAKVTALAGELGKGLSPQAAGRVQQQAFGALSSDPLGWERFLGHGILDKQGHVEDPTKVMKEITEKTKKRYGKDALRVLRLNFGAETGSALFNADYGEATKAAGLAPSKAGGTALGALNATDAGQRNVADAKLAESSRALMGSSTNLGRAADALQKFAASNPFTSTLGVGMGQAAAGFGIGRAGSLAKGLFQGGSKGAIAATEGMAGIGAMGAVFGVAAAGAIGYGIGTIIDNKLGLSDAISKVGFAGKREAGDARASAEVQANTRKRLDRIAQLEAGGMSHGKAIYAADHESTKPIADAVTAGLKAVKFTIVNATGGPIEIADEGAQSLGAGNQGG
jgi:hypothetical protein